MRPATTATPASPLSGLTAAPSSPPSASTAAQPTPRGAPRWELPRTLAGAAAAAYLTSVAALVAFAVLPLLLGWSTYVVASDSMAPVIRAGDALVSAPVDPATLKEGQVVLVDDPAVPGRTLSHRVEEIRADGSLITRGDANAHPDSTPAPPDAVQGLGRLLVPYVGLPGHWLSEGRFLPVLVWLAVTGLAVVAAATDPSRRRRRGSRDKTPRFRWPTGRRRAVGAGAATGSVLVVLATAAAAPLVVTVEPVHAAFRAASSNATNAFAARPDWVAPDTNAVTVAKTSPAGYLTGRVRPSSSYRVHANVTDTGNPASGVANVVADLSAVPAGNPNTALSAGSATVGGIAYNYRSATLTAGASTGTKGYSLTMTDAATNSRTRAGYSVVIDGAAPTPTNVETVNQPGGTAGRPETGDSLTFTYSEQIDPYSILSGWTGAAQTITLRFEKVGGRNQISLLSNGGAALPLGTIATANGNRFTETTLDFTGSTITQSGGDIRITLGTPSGSAVTIAEATALTWTPAVGLYDAAGNNATTTTTTENGVSDFNF